MIQWTPSLAIGIQEIDEQHQAIIKLANELRKEKTRGNARAANETLRFLRNYMNDHFALEEKLMQDLDYPGLENHKQQHELFINHVIFFEIEKEFGLANEQMQTDILAFLRDWISDHIAAHDKALGAFARRQDTAG